MIEKKIGELTVKIYRTRDEMGKAAAEEAAACILECLDEKETINCIFAAAPSQNEFLAALAADKRIPWGQVNAFHMDEYVGLPVMDKRSFSGFLSDAIFGQVPFRSVNLLNGMTETEEETRRYSRLLEENPVDIVFMGVGENGHIAFNDPGTADFRDAKLVKEVVLEEVCRKQQVNDGCFLQLEDVPKKALTVTVPGLMRGRHIFCMVPNGRKAEAIKRMLSGQISENCPASILRKKKGAKLYLDQESAALI